MPVEIAGGPPLLSINHGATFMVTDLGGEIQADTEQGVFADDTRFVSYYAIFASGLPWQRLNSAATAYYAARIYLTNAVVLTEDGDVPAGTLSLVIGRTVADGIHEDLDIANHGLVAVRFNLEIALRSDFADLFEVKLGHLVRRGRILTRWHDRRAELETSYTNRDFRRSLVYRLLNTSSPPAYANGRVPFMGALQSMTARADVPRGALRSPAERRATEQDALRAADPGKTPHGVRAGGPAHSRLTPHTPYYGTADATPLYLIVLHEAWK